MKWSLASLLWLIAYVATLLAVTGVVLKLRAVALGTYGTTEALADWEAWRADAKKMAEEPFPVKRRVPTSAEPPALVLMRESTAATLVTCGG